MYLPPAFIRLVFRFTLKLYHYIACVLYPLYAAAAVDSLPKRAFDGVSANAGAVAEQIEDAAISG